MVVAAAPNTNHVVQNSRSLIHTSPTTSSDNAFSSTPRNITLTGGFSTNRSNTRSNTTAKTPLQSPNISDNSTFCHFTQPMQEGC